MHDTAPAVAFVRTLARAVLRADDPERLAGAAGAALDEVFRAHKSLVLEIQFTGFSWRGQLLGGVDPELLRAAGQLIVLRVQRLGFTPDAGRDDVEKVFRAIGTPGAELGEGGVLGALSGAEPHGVYASSASGEVYRPPARGRGEITAAEPGDGAEPTEPSRLPGSTAPAQPYIAPEEEIERTELSDFELVDPLGSLPETNASPAPSRATTTPADAAQHEEPLDGDLYHFFRASAGGGASADPDALPRMLRESENLTRYDELVELCAKQVAALARAEEYESILTLLGALVAEAVRPDRTRFFRESATQGLRRGATPDVLHRLLERLGQREEDREPILRVFALLGADSAALLEGLLFRTADRGLGVAIGRALLRIDGYAEGMLGRALADPAPARTRLLLEFAARAEMDPEVALRWAGKGAAHADAEVRAEAARLAGAVGGRGGMRALVDLLNDGDREVRLEAVRRLGGLGEAAAVPFLARVASESGDEELQLAALEALGRTRSAEAIPPLLATLNKRQLFAGRRAMRLKSAALHALGRVGTPAAHEALNSVARGKESDLAEEARRILDTPC